MVNLLLQALCDVCDYGMVHLTVMYDMPHVPCLCCAVLCCAVLCHVAMQMKAPEIQPCQMVIGAGCPYWCFVSKQLLYDMSIPVLCDAMLCR
jgi:hypothetical protein